MKNFIKRLIQDNVTDLFVSGYTDMDNHQCFHPMYEKLFFVVNNETYELYLVDGVICANQIDDITLWFDIDEDDRFTLMSVYSQAFKTEQEVKIFDVNYSKTPFASLFIKYKDGDNERCLQLDPKNFFGFTF